MPRSIAVTVVLPARTLHDTAVLDAGGKGVLTKLQRARRRALSPEGVPLRGSAARKRSVGERGRGRGRGRG